MAGLVKLATTVFEDPGLAFCRRVPMNPDSGMRGAGQRS
jgi:hypothetical protein